MSELYHYGVPHGKGPTGRGSGRYPWGSGDSGRPPRLSRKERKKMAEAAKRKEENLKKARDAAQNKRLYEKEKQRVLKEGTATEILKFQNDLTVKDMEDAIRRIEATRKLKNISQQEINDGWKKVNSAMGKVGDVKNWAKTGLESYQVFSQIYDVINKEMNKSSKKKS